jgi:VIT1/CCC1 family predicted Fe2+/Mn2+ transporter
MTRLRRHRERHLVARIGWLRAAVLGANDGIVSTASLIVGVAASAATHNDILIAGIAGLVAGSMSMAAGEYVSVSSQLDTERADLARERKELRDDSASEHRELAAIYVKRGLDADLAKKVAQQLMAKDALGAHARDELGISEVTTARPIQAGLTSAATFAAGAALPLLMAIVSPAAVLVPLVSIAALAFLALLRAPTPQEWSLLDEKLSVLSSYLDPILRWKKRLTELGAYFRNLPIFFLFFSIVSLLLSVGGVIFADLIVPSALAFFHAGAIVLWTLALGGLGACAFFGTTLITESAKINTPSGQQSPNSFQLNSEFDLTGRNLLLTRLVVGILFAFLLGLPLSAGSLDFIVDNILNTRPDQIRSTADLNSDARNNVAALCSWFQDDVGSSSDGQVCFVNSDYFRNYFQKARLLEKRAPPGDGIP